MPCMTLKGLFIILFADRVAVVATLKRHPKVNKNVCMATISLKCNSFLQICTKMGSKNQFCTLYICTGGKSKFSLCSKAVLALGSCVHSHRNTVKCYS